MQFLLRRKGIISDSPSSISPDIVVEPPVYLANVIVGPNVKIGKHTRILSGRLWNDIVIGRYCGISHNVHIAPGEHALQYLSVLDYFYSKADYYLEEMRAKKTFIGNDVLIGVNAVVKSGVRVGDGAVIGSNAVVLKDVPAYSIVVGVPAKIVKYRFSEEIIAKLLQLKWWEMDERILKGLKFNDVENCIKILGEARNIHFKKNSSKH